MVDIVLSTRLTADEAARRINDALLAAHVEEEARAFAVATYRVRDLADTIAAALKTAPSARFVWQEATAQ